jgi:molybdopterin-guanine dinucleotide biosynthesis protein A
MGLPNVGGYVLAGGMSLRMGRDKARLELGAKPLALHAVTKLRRVCPEVHILSNRPELKEFAPLVRDLHEGCGPMGGLEAALEHSHHEWNLFMPVDVPFLPSSFLDTWVREVSSSQLNGARVAMFTVGGVPQPLFCLLHREVRPFIREAMQRGEYKVFPVLAGAASELAARAGLGVDRVFLNRVWEEEAEFIAESDEGDEEPWRRLTEAQKKTRRLWFANLNTLEEFAEAETSSDALDT